MTAVTGASNDQQAHEARLSLYWQQQQESGARLLGYAVRHPSLTARAVADLRALPRLDAGLTGSQEGGLLREHLTMRRFGAADGHTLRSLLTWWGAFTLARTGACVLSIPSDGSQYSDGSSRQTLRRKVRAAERQSVCSRRVDHLAEQRELARMLDLVLPHKSDHRYRQYNTDHSFMVGVGLWTAAFDQEGQPLALAVTPIDGQWALLQCFISLGETQQHSGARYLLTKAMVQQLADRGVRYLVDTRSPMELTNGLRHFQRMVGFRIVRIRVLPDQIFAGDEHTIVVGTPHDLR